MGQRKRLGLSQRTTRAVNISGKVGGRESPAGGPGFCGGSGHEINAEGKQ